MISRDNERWNGSWERSQTDRPPRRGSRTIPAELRAHILAQLANGRRVMEVAREYGVHQTTISRWKREQRAHQTAADAAAPGREDTPERPAETGRYSQAFKDEVLAQVRSGRSIVEVAAQYGLPQETLGRWTRRAAAAGGQLPPPASTRPTASGPSPIDENHRRSVLALKDRHPNMGLAQIQNQLKRFDGLRLSRHTIARILKEAGIPLQKPKRNRSEENDPSENRFEMSRPNELWAVDFKEFWIHADKAYALFILDDFSRFCVGFALTQKPSADLAIATVERAIQRYGRPERILSDRGPQFHAWNGVSRFDEFLAEFFTDHTVAKSGHPFTNGKLEAFNRSVEEELLQVEEFASLADAERGIAQYVRRYNFLRTHMGVAGLVPADRYFGMVEEAQQALLEGLKRLGPGLRWLKGLVSHDGPALRPPALLQLVVADGKLELVVLGRRFRIG